jgi:hypothetical protein
MAPHRFAEAAAEIEFAKQAGVLEGDVGAAFANLLSEPDQFGGGGHGEVR